MSGQLGLELSVIGRGLGQFFQQPWQRRGLCNDLCFAGAVRGQTERLGERGSSLVRLTLLGMSFRQRDVQVRDFALIEIFAKLSFVDGVSIIRHGEAESAQI